MGKRLFFTNFSCEDGQSVAEITGIDEESLDGFSSIHTRLKRTGKTAYLGFWDVGSDAFVPATYNAFPVGSIVHDFIGEKLYYKQGATTWVYGAIAT